jgi:hypothetical protein
MADSVIDFLAGPKPPDNQVQDLAIDFLGSGELTDGSENPQTDLQNRFKIPTGNRLLVIGLPEFLLGALGIGGYLGAKELDRVRKGTQVVFL